MNVILIKEVVNISVIIILVAIHVPVPLDLHHIHILDAKVNPVSSYCNHEDLMRLSIYRLGS